MARIATAETEGAWLEVAARSTNREFEAAVRASVDGTPPAEVEPDDEVRWVLRMSRAEAELVQAVLVWLRASCGPGTEGVEDGALVAMALQRLVADADPDTAPSPDRSRFVIEAATASDDPVRAEACCDADVVEVGAGPTRGHVTRTIPPATRRAVLARDRRQCSVPGCTNRLWLDLHHVVPRASGGSNAEGNLVTVCGVHHRMVHQGQLAIGVGGGRGSP